MKKLSFLLAFLASLISGVALANNAVVTSVTGSAQVQIGTAAPRVLRVGDELQQGATVSTGTASSLVLKFDDGQVAALTSSSRMTITAYQYNPQAGTGNVLLSLLDGGMRAITGLIGRRSPDRVTYPAATATIGIRGTDAIIVTANGNVVVSVVEGAITFTFAGQTIVIPAGQGVNARTDGTFQQAAAAQILAQIPPALAAMINGLTGLSNAIQQAAAGTPRRGGDQDNQGDRGDRGDNRGGGTQGPNNPPGGGGGGSASQR
jgi:hypothetical protein